MIYVVTETEDIGSIASIKIVDGRDGKTVVPTDLIGTATFAMIPRNGGVTWSPTVGCSEID